MIIETRIKLTSPILGEFRKDRAGIRRFKTTSGGDIAIDPVRWNEQFLAAIKNLRSPVDSRTIQPSSSYLSPTIVLYRRIYSKIHVELFESIRKGAELTWEFCLREDLPKSPTLDQFKDIMATTGKYFGLSQFGSRFGFGRFTLMQVTDINSNHGQSEIPLGSGRADHSEPDPGH